MERSGKLKGYSERMCELFASRHLFHSSNCYFKGREHSAATRASTTLNNTTLSRNESNLKTLNRNEVYLLTEQKTHILADQQLHTDSPRKLIKPIALNRDRPFRISASVNRSLKWNAGFEPANKKSKAYLSHRKPAEPAFEKRSYDSTLLTLKRMARGTNPRPQTSALATEETSPPAGEPSQLCGDAADDSKAPADARDNPSPQPKHSKLASRDTANRDIRNQVRQLNYALALKRIKNLQLDADQYLDYIIVAATHPERRPAWRPQSSLDEPREHQRSRRLA